MGWMYEHGEGCEPAPRKSQEYYDLTVRTEDLEGEVLLGNLYYEGSKTEQDYEEALRWYEKAEELKYPCVSYGNMGHIHEYGKADCTSLDKAGEYYRLAADQMEKRFADIEPLDIDDEMEFYDDKDLESDDEDWSKE